MTKTGEQKIPTGMTPQEFEEARRKLKREAQRQCFVTILFITAIPGLLLWDSLAHPFVTKRMDELTKVSGQYYIHTYGRRGGRHTSGLSDAKTHQSLFVGTDRLCGMVGDRFDLRPLFGGRDKTSFGDRSINRKVYVGKPATFWYARSQMLTDKKDIIYQMEIDGEIVCPLEKANRRAETINSADIKCWLWIELLVICLALIASYIHYRNNLRHLRRKKA